MAEESKLRGTVHVRVTENVTLENLQRIIATIGGMAGCRPCGILGIDLRLTADPVDPQQIANLPSVNSVSFE